MSCVDNIVTLGLCDDEQPSSGLTLMQAAGMSPKNLDKIAAEQYVQGARLAEVKKRLAITFMRNDLIGVMQANRIATTLADPVYDSCKFDPATDMGLFAGNRGIKIHGATDIKTNGLRKLKLKSIQCYPLVSGAGEIIVVDIISGVTTEIPYAVTFVANRVNTFSIDYTAQNRDVMVLINNAEINFASAPVICHKGCDGGAPNPCAWVDGWDGAGAVKKEGFGINVQFYCTCDYDQLICDLAKTMTGELIWLKWQELIFDEQLKTNRFNNWVVYNREELQGVVDSLGSQYASKFNNMVSGGLFNILQNYRDGCLTCRGIRKITNV